MKKYLFVSSLALVAAAGSAFAQEACSSYVIQRGDTLRQLALRVYGTEDYRPIYEANRETIGKNPNIIRLGDTLQMPCVTAEAGPAAVAETEAERMAADMAAELIRAAEERAAKAIAEAEARVAAAEEEARKASEEAVIAARAAARAEIEQARAEGAALIREAGDEERPAIRDRQLLLITGGGYAPFTDESLPNRGLYTKLVETAPGVFAAEINASLCKGCGTCTSWCPSGAIQSKHFTSQQVHAMIDAFFPEEALV